MKSKEVDRLLHARSICLEWGLAIASAKESVTIYTPFLDRLVFNLLKKNSELPSESCRIITSLDGQGLTQWPNQSWKKLRTIKELIEDGHRVFELARLHAKVLLIDDKIVIFGSQNFTHYAQGSKEVSAGPFEHLDRTTFLKSLLEWRQQARLIEEAEVDGLLESLGPHIKRLKKVLIPFRNLTSNLHIRKVHH